MKKQLLYGLLLLAFALLPSVAGAQLKQSVGAWIEGGEWSLLPRESRLQNSLGAGGALGFAYELEQKHFIFQTGFGVFMGKTRFNSPDTTAVLSNIWDNDFVGENEQFDFVYNMRNRRDAYTNMAVQIPLLLGGSWRRFYFMGGVKLNMSVITRTAVTGMLTTEGQYTEGGKAKYDPFRDMPEHQFFTDRESAFKSPAHFNLDVDASFEMGVRMGYVASLTGFDVPKSKTQYRLAVFADYGLLDIHKAGTNLPMTTPPMYNPDDMISGLKMNDILSTRDAASAVANLFVGLKFTVLFQLPDKSKCVICHDSRSRLYRGGTKIERD